MQTLIHMRIVPLDWFSPTSLALPFSSFHCSFRLSFTLSHTFLSKRLRAHSPHSPAHHWNQACQPCLMTHFTFEPKRNEKFSPWKPNCYTPAPKQHINHIFSHPFLQSLTPHHLITSLLSVPCLCTCSTVTYILCLQRLWPLCTYLFTAFTYLTRSPDPTERPQMRRGTKKKGVHTWSRTYLIGEQPNSPLAISLIFSLSMCSSNKNNHVARIFEPYIPFTPLHAHSLNFISFSCVFRYPTFLLLYLLPPRTKIEETPNYERRGLAKPIMRFWWH